MVLGRIVRPVWGLLWLTLGMDHLRSYMDFFQTFCGTSGWERLVISLSVKLSCMPWLLWDGSLENGCREDEASGGLTMKQPDIAWSRESVGARVCSNCAVHSMTLRLPFPHTLGLSEYPATVTRLMRLLVFRLTVFARSLVFLMPLRFPLMNPSSSSWSHELVWEWGKDPPAKSLASMVGQNIVSQLSKPSSGTAGNERIPFEPQTAQSQLTKGKRSDWNIN